MEFSEKVLLQATLVKLFGYAINLCSPPPYVVNAFSTALNGTERSKTVRMFKVLLPLSNVKL